jgi:hypothetical protein
MTTPKKSIDYRNEAYALIGDLTRQVQTWIRANPEMPDTEVYALVGEAMQRLHSLERLGYLRGLAEASERVGGLLAFEAR